MEVRPKWTEEELDIIFSKAILVQDGLRKDASGVYIHRDAYGKAEHPWGWEVDHIKPISEGGTNSFRVSLTSLSDNYRTLRILVLLIDNTILSSYQ